MRVFLVLVLWCSGCAAGELQAFGYQWTVPVPADWSVVKGDGGEVLRLVQHRGPLPGPRRPIQFALAETGNFGRVRMEADVRPLQRSLMIVFAYRDPAHFDYAHLSTDTGSKQTYHNGIFHVYGGERVRISSERGPASFKEAGKWSHVVLNYDASSGRVRVTVDGRAIPALDAVDLSLGPGRVGLGSFDETAEFRNVKISGEK